VFDFTFAWPVPLSQPDTFQFQTPEGDELWLRWSTEAGNLDSTLSRDDELLEKQGACCGRPQLSAGGHGTTHVDR
jgi:hypothetical protein